MTPNPHREAGVDSRLRDAAHALLRQWNAYRESDLSQMNAHDLLVRYELWNALDAALWGKSPATNQEAGAARPLASWRCKQCTAVLWKGCVTHGCALLAKLEAGEAK